MAFETLTYNPGQGVDSSGPSRALKIASVINELGKRGVASERHNQDVADREAKKAALADSIQGIIDPFKAENDLAYAATTLKVTLADELQKRAANLKDPAHPDVQMDPKDYAKRLQQEATAFYEQNANSKFAGPLAEVFSKYTLQNQKKLIAAQADAYKKVRKSHQQSRGVVALSSQPNMVQEAYNLNTTELIRESFPDTMFLPEEVRSSVMSAAVVAAKAGDRRLLDFAIAKMDADALLPTEVALAEKEYLHFADTQKEDYWNSQYKSREELADTGAYSHAMYAKDMSDKDIYKRFGRTTPGMWLRRSMQVGNSQRQMSSYIDAFKLGHPMVGARQKDVDSVSQTVFSALLEDNKNDLAETYKQWAPMLAASGRIDNGLQQSAASYLGRSFWSAESVNAPAFKEFFGLVTILDQHMSEAQLEKQLGSEAFSNFVLFSDALRINGMDFEKAANDLSNITQRRKELGLEEKLSKEENDMLSEAVSEVLDGDLKTSDRDLRKFFGMFSRSGNMVLSQPAIRAEMLRQAKYEKMKGHTGDRAVELAAVKVAKNYKYFGNELHFTGGAPVGPLFGFAEGTPMSEMNRGFDDFAESLGKDPDDVHLRREGNRIYISDSDGNELPPVPATLIGAHYQVKRMREIQADKAKTVEERALRAQKINDDFQNRLYSMYGTDNPKAEFAKGITVGSYEVADDETKTAMRLAWQDEYYWAEKAILRSMISTGGSVLAFFKDKIGSGLNQYTLANTEDFIDEIQGTPVYPPAEMSATYPTSERFGYGK